MSKKIKVNISGFGEMYCSDNVEYNFLYNKIVIFYKKGTVIRHNEFGPSWISKAKEYPHSGYSYSLNNKLHRLKDIAYFSSRDNYKEYFVIGISLGHKEKDFIEDLANVLIPKW